MNISRLRLITFDVTDTLLKFKTSPGKQYGEIGALYGIMCDNQSLTVNFKAHWRKMNRDHPNFGKDTGLGWETWWKMVVGGTFRDCQLDLDEKKLDSIACHLISVYETSMCWQESHGAVDLLTYLRNKGLMLGVVSNFDPRLHNTLVNNKLRHYFNFVLTSYESGVEKPHPAIFKKAQTEAALIDLKPEECLHVGNTASLDYVGAKNSGWHAILVHNKLSQEILDQHPYVDKTHFFPSLYNLHQYFLETKRERFRTNTYSV